MVFVRLWFTIIVSNHVIAQSNQQQQWNGRNLQKKYAQNHLYILCGYLKCMMCMGQYNRKWNVLLSIVPPARFEEYVIFFLSGGEEQKHKVFIWNIISFSNSRIWTKWTDDIISEDMIWMLSLRAHVCVCVCLCNGMASWVRKKKRDQTTEESNGYR